ncbi:MAG: hypothetical protein WBF90_34465 [Rivularia sp. (in: cyanobacteria)]
MPVTSPIPNPQCPMPNAQCPMPDAQSKIQNFCCFMLKENKLREY